MSVEVEISPVFARYAGNQVTIPVKGNTVGECIHDLVEQYPDLKKIILDSNGKLQHSFDVFINGESAYPNEMEKPVKDGDKLHIVLLIHGG